MALTLAPATIWLLSDGEFDNPSIGANLIAAVRARRIPVNTIAFHSQGDQTLLPISEASGGRYLYVPGL